MKLAAFIYNDRIYVRAIPGKKLFNSTMVHQVVNRMDVFALDLFSQEFTIIPGKANVEHIELDITRLPTPVVPLTDTNLSAREKLARTSARLKDKEALLKEPQQGELL